MTLTIHRNDERILIKYVDSSFNVFKHIINHYDKFVIDYFGGKLEKLEKILQNYILEEMDNCVIFKIEEPLFIKYTLVKENTTRGESFGLVLSKINQLEKEISQLKIRTDCLEEQLENGVILPGYAGGVIPIDTTELLLGVKKDYNHPDFKKYPHPQTRDENMFFDPYSSHHYTLINVNNNEFRGITIKPVSFLSNLQIFAFHYNQITTDFTPLAPCITLKELYFNTCNISNIEFVKNLKNLTIISFYNCPELSDLNPLLECPSLREITYSNCPKIFNLPSFPGSIKIVKV